VRRLDQHEAELLARGYGGHPYGIIESSQPQPQ
jgi:hypothetical protein